MVELPELNDEQRLFLKTVFEYFHVEGKWPTYLWVENTILQTHHEKRSEFDLTEICKSLPDGFASGFSFNHQYGQQAAFIAPVLYYFPEAKEDMADFIRVVHLCLDKINTSIEESTEILSEDLSNQLHMQPLAIRKMGLLLLSEPDIHNGSSANASEGWWRIALLRGKYGVRRFIGVETFEQYLEKRSALTRMFSGNVAVRPVQNEPANTYPVFAKEVVMDTIKVLFLAANPLGTDRLKLDEEIRTITEKVYASEYRDYLQVESSWAIRPDDLLQLLNRHRPHIVHFSGHGSHTGELILVDNTGSPKAVSTIALKALFTTLKDNIQVVILNACYSWSQATAITEVINCVVGMNDAIGDEAAIIFAASFYRALGFGRSVQDAFDQGKVALLLEGIPEENTPELLVRTGVNPSRIFLVEQPIEKQQINQEQQRHIALLRKLKTEYILSHPNVSERILVGTEPLPKEWVERRLEEMGQAMSNETTPLPSHVEVAGTTIILSSDEAALVVYMDEKWRGQMVTIRSGGDLYDYSAEAHVIARSAGDTIVYAAIFPCLPILSHLKPFYENQKSGQYDIHFREASSKFKKQNLLELQETVTLFAGNISKLDWRGKKRTRPILRG